MRITEKAMVMTATETRLRKALGTAMLWPKKKRLVKSKK